MTGADGAAAQRADRIVRDGWSCALAVLSVLAQGHHFPAGNQDWQLPALRRMIDPTYLSGDWALSLAMPHDILMHGLMLPAVRLLGESGGILALHLITRVVLMTGAWRLVAAMMPRARYAPFAAMVLTVLEPRLWLGGHFLQAAHWEPAHLGMALGVWVLAQGAAWIGGDAPPWKCGVAGGLAVLAHLFIGLPVLAVVTIAALARGTGVPLVTDQPSAGHGQDAHATANGACRLRALRGIGVIALVSAVIGAPAWGPAAAGFFHPGQRVLPDDVLILGLEVRHPHHHMPWLWPAMHWGVAGAIVVLGWLAMTFSNVRRAVPVALYGWYAVTGAAFFASTWLLVSPFVAYFQFFRILGLVLLTSAIGVACAAEFALARTTGRARLELATVSVLALVTFRVPVLFVPLAARVVFAAYRRRHDEEAALSDLPQRLARTWPIALACGVVGVLTLQCVAPVRDALACVAPFHWGTSAAPAYRDRAAVSEWIASHTAPADVLLVPVNETGFRNWEERPIVVDYKFVPYRNAEYAEWLERVLVVRGFLPPESHAPPETLRPLLTQLREAQTWRNNPAFDVQPDDPPASLARLRAVAKRYGAEWIVWRGPVASRSEEPAFSEGDWTVWRVEPPDS